MKIVILITLVVLLADRYPAAPTTPDAPAIDKDKRQASTTPSTPAKTQRTPATDLSHRAPPTIDVKLSSTPTRKSLAHLPTRVPPTRPPAQVIKTESGYNKWLNSPVQRQCARMTLDRSA